MYYNFFRIKSNLRKGVIYLRNAHAQYFQNDSVDFNQKNSEFATSVLERYAFSHALATSGFFICILILTR